MFNVETKSFRDIALNDYPVPPSEFARMWLDCVAVHGMLERSILQSFDWRTLIAAKAIEPRVAISVLTEDPKEDLVATAVALRPEWMSPRWDMPNVTRTGRGPVARARRANRRMDAERGERVDAPGLHRRRFDHHR